MGRREGGWGGGKEGGEAGRREGSVGRRKGESGEEGGSLGSVGASYIIHLGSRAVLRWKCKVPSIAATLEDLWRCKFYMLSWCISLQRLLSNDLCMGGPYIARLWDAW